MITCKNYLYAISSQTLNTEILSFENQIKRLHTQLKEKERELRKLQIIEHLQSSAIRSISDKVKFAKIKQSEIAKVKVNDKNWLDIKLINVIEKVDEKKNATFHMCPGSNCRKRHPLVVNFYEAYCGDGAYEDAAKIYILCKNNTNPKQFRLFSVCSSIEYIKGSWFEH